MTRSEGPTDYILIRAESNSDWDPAHYAIVHLDQAYRRFLTDRLAAVTHFKNDNLLSGVSYWDERAVFYRDSDRANTDILWDDEDWAYVAIQDNELMDFLKPENQMDAGQIVLSNQGYANYTAYSKRTNESYWTEYFSIKQILSL